MVTSYWFGFYFALWLQFNCSATRDNIEPGTTPPSSCSLFSTPKTWLSFVEYLREAKKWWKWHKSGLNCSGLYTITTYRDWVIQILVRKVKHKLLFFCSCFCFFYEQKSIWQIKKPCGRQRERERESSEYVPIFVLQRA